MKPFLGIDLTTDKKNEKFNGEEFLVAVPSSAITQSYERFSEKAEETIGKSKLPLPLRIGQGIFGIVSAIVILGIIKALTRNDNISIAQAYENVPWIFWLGGISLLSWGVLKFISIRKEKNTFDSDESKQTISTLDSIGNEIYSELSVPSDSKEIDILSFFYKIKNNEIKVCEKGLQMTPYFNPVFNIFTDSENLYLANFEGKYAFPLSSLVAIRTVNKHIRILGWNKDEDFNKGFYKQFKLTKGDYNCIHCKSYYILEINHKNELWGLYIPIYELPIFEELTGLKAD